MRLSVECMVVEKGVYGPFEDGRSYPFARLADGESGIVPVTLAPEFVGDLDVLVKGVADVEYYANQSGKLKARLHSFTVVKQR